MKLLVIEDEQKLRAQLLDDLQTHGYIVETASDGEEGLYLGSEYAYDLAVIDLGLPKISGVEVIQALRNKNIATPILILTARGNWQDKVEGLDAGADDYLVKPFHLEELLARVKALLRRSKGQPSSLLNFGNITINLNTKIVSKNNSQLELTSYEYNTLEHLALKSGQVISKTELTDHLYKQDFDRDSNVIEVFIGRLRKKLDPTNVLKPIKTVRGQGYSFVLQAEHIAHG